MVIIFINMLNDRNAAPAAWQGKQDLDIGCCPTSRCILPGNKIDLANYFVK